MKRTISDGHPTYRMTMMFFDVVAVVLAVEMSLWVRLRLNPLAFHEFTSVEARELMVPTWAVLPVWILIFHLAGMYTLGRRISLSRLFVMVLKGAGMGLVALVFMVYFLTEVPNRYSRSLVLLLFGFSVVLLLLWRSVGLVVSRRLKRRGAGSENVAILGTNGGSHHLAEALGRADGMAVNLKGFITTDPNGHDGRRDSTTLGSILELSEIINRHHIHRIMVGDPRLREEDMLLCAGTCQKMSVRLGYVPDLVGVPSGKLRFTVVEDIPFLEIDADGLKSWQRQLKRAFDVAVVVLTAPLWVPVFAVVALLVKLDSPGPVLYTSLRVGKGGRFFRFMKFRSMYLDAKTRMAEVATLNEKSGHIFKIKDDPRVTRVGKILRRLSLDELPQLLNVLIGQMSLVGPRPLPVETFEPDGESSNFPWWSSRRHSVLPGLTGLWQVSGRSDLDFEQMVDLDLQYIERWSLLTDLSIMTRTVPAVLGVNGAY